MTEFLAHYVRSDELDAAFAAGLFHDVGRLLILTTLPEVAPKIVVHWEQGEGVVHRLGAGNSRRNSYGAFRPHPREVEAPGACLSRGPFPREPRCVRERYQRPRSGAPCPCSRCVRLPRRLGHSFLRRPAPRNRPTPLSRRSALPMTWRAFARSSRRSSIRSEAPSTTRTPHRS